MTCHHTRIHLCDSEMTNMCLYFLMVRSRQKRQFLNSKVFGLIRPGYPTDNLSYSRGKCSHSGGIYCLIIMRMVRVKDVQTLKRLYYCKLYMVRNQFFKQKIVFANSIIITRQNEFESLNKTTQDNRKTVAKFHYRRFTYESQYVGF